MCPLQDYPAVADSQVLIFPSPMNRAEEGKHFRENPAARSVGTGIYWVLRSRLATLPTTNQCYV